MFVFTLYTRRVIYIRTKIYIDKQTAKRNVQSNSDDLAIATPGFHADVLIRCTDTVHCV